MDNLRAHKVPGIREAIEKARATVRYLPKYSPDLNPIEMPYNKFKALLRKAAEQPFGASTEQFDRSCHCSVLKNARTISAPDMLQNEGNRFSDGTLLIPIS